MTSTYINEIKYLKFISLNSNFNMIYTLDF